MKHTITKTLAAAVMGAVLLTAFQCGKDNPMDEVNPVYNAHHSACKSNSDAEAKGIYSPDSVSYTYSDGVLHVTHHNLTVNCGSAAEDGVIDVSVIRSNETTLAIYENESADNAQADCMCDVDNEFDIHGLEHGSYTLVFYSWDPSPHPVEVTF